MVEGKRDVSSREGVEESRDFSGIAFATPVEWEPR